MRPVSELERSAVDEAAVEMVAKEMGVTSLARGMT